MSKNKKKKKEVNYQKIVAIILLLGMIASFIASIFVYF